MLRAPSPRASSPYARSSATSSSSSTGAAAGLAAGLGGSAMRTVGAEAGEEVDGRPEAPEAPEDSASAGLATAGAGAGGEEAAGPAAGFSSAGGEAHRHGSAGREGACGAFRATAGGGCAFFATAACCTRSVSTGSCTSPSSSSCSKKRGITPRQARHQSVRAIKTTTRVRDVSRAGGAPPSPGTRRRRSQRQRYPQTCGCRRQARWAPRPAWGGGGSAACQVLTHCGALP